MKSLLKSIRQSTPLTFTRGCMVNPIGTNITPIINVSAFSNLDQSFGVRYNFATFKQQKPQHQEPFSHSQDKNKDSKILQLKDIFQTKMNKYNLKALIKMYQIIKHNNIPLSPSTLKQFDYRLVLELNSLDHHSTNSILEITYRNGHTYHNKGKNKLLRGINLQLQKNKLIFEPQHVYKTLKLLIEMNFPKQTIARVMFKLVQETEVSKRMLCMISNLNALKISLLAVEMLEVDLEIKKRILENFLLIKPKGIMELGYFYSVLKTAVNRLDEAVLYEAQKKTVYDLAFNPYSMYEEKENSTQAQVKYQNPQTTNTSNTTPNEINPIIMKRLLQQKQLILEETLKKLNLSQISQQIYNQLSEIMKDEQNDELEWKEMKQLCMMLLGNRFGEEGKEKRELVAEMVGSILKEGLGVKENGNVENDRNEGAESNKLIRLPQFIILAQQLSQSTTTPSKNLAPYFSAYHNTYYHFMNLQQKLMFTYHKSKLLNQPIDFKQIKEELEQISYGLNTEEFGWLGKVIEINKDKHSIEERNMIKAMWAMVEGNLDRELTVLEKERQQKQQRQAQEKQHKRQPKQQTNSQQAPNNNNNTQSQNTTHKN